MSPDSTSTAAGLVAMYHYVRPDGEPVPDGIRPFMTGEFEAQLDWIEERYDIVGTDEFLAWLTRPNGRRRPPCLLTLDDGVRDHHDVVLPILQRRGLSAIVFALSWPISHGRMPITHAVHWLLSRDEADVWAAFTGYAEQELDGLAALGDPATAKRLYYLEPERRARIKYAANVALPPTAVEEIVAAELARDGVTTDDLAKEWFLTADDLRALDAAGVTVGMHGMTHRSLQQIGADGIRSEIRSCRDTLHDVLGRPPEWWAAPFGGSGADPSLHDVMRETLRAHGVRAGCTTELRLVEPGGDPLAIPRLDAIDLPPRREPPVEGIAAVTPAGATGDTR